MVRIGHASIDENGRAKGGAAGDQTGKEVCIRSWYSKPWDYVLRYSDASIREQMAKACEAGCLNPNIGYDQNQRNTLHTEAKKVGYDLSKVGKCETDCSAFMTVCAISAGIGLLEYDGNAPTTSTMKGRFQSAGFKVLATTKYTSSDNYLLRGDILVKAGSHTVMVLDNGARSVVPELAKPTLKVGSKGEEVKKLQKSLNYFGASLDVDGDFGKKTKSALMVFQQNYGNLVVDGIYGQKSYAAMADAID